MSQSTISVGTNHLGYLEKRNFASLPFEEVEVKRVYDLFTIPNYLYFRFSGRSHPFLQFSHLDLGLSPVDLFHFFFTIPWSSQKPWIVSFSSWFPRWDSSSKVGLKRLAHPSCKRLIAISQNAMDIQRRKLSTFPEIADAVIPKLQVIHPAQPLIINSYAEKQFPQDGKIHFTFVGADFFRKGGREILQAFVPFFEEKAPVHLNIVSSLRVNDYATHATAADQAWAKKLIERYPEYISWWSRLPNREVLALLSRSHVGLLPTYADTYGYSVLESMACGCPVISTDIRALPEVNAESRGWIIPVPQNEDREARRFSPQQRQELSERIQEGLIQVIAKIVSKRRLIEAKGNDALSYIKAHHSPTERAEQLSQLYREAL